MATDQTPQKSLFDALFCEEEKWGDVEDEEDDEDDNESEITSNNLSLFPLLLLEQDLFWDDEELQSLFIKERETSLQSNDNGTGFSLSSLSLQRKEGVEWILKINAHYGFSALTAILAVNYLDRFLSSLSFSHDKPWMMQLASVACLSLAAKVEETHVPLLLDLQVEGAKYLFEAKTIQKMELLVLTGLKWRMNPVTPLSFLDHIIRRLGLKSYIHWEFLRTCENLLLSVISDPRFTLYVPSVLATSTMLHVIHQVEPRNGSDYENQLLSVLKISKEEVNDCYEVISEVVSNNQKRKFSDSSYDSWETSSCVSSSSSSPHQQPVFKKTRVEEHEQMRLSSLSRVFVDAVWSPH